MIFVFLCLISLHMIISRSIHVAANGIIPFLFMLLSLESPPHLHFPHFSVYLCSPCRRQACSMSPESPQVCSLGLLKALVLNLGCTRTTRGAAQNTNTYWPSPKFSLTFSLPIRISRNFLVVPTGRQDLNLLLLKDLWFWRIQLHIKGKLNFYWCESIHCSVVLNSLWPCGL